MIIDTTRSSMERKMCVARRFEDAFSPRKRNKEAKAQYRAAAVRDFLLKRGEVPPKDLTNTMVFWEDGEVKNVFWIPRAKEEELADKPLLLENPWSLREFQSFMIG